MIHVYESRSGRFQTDAPTSHGPDGEDCRLIETRETINPTLPGFAQGAEVAGHRFRTLEPSDLSHAAETPASRAKAARENASAALAAAKAAEATARAAEEAAK